MRIFKDFKEAAGEIKRDLKEMGILIKNTSMQDKPGEFSTLELVNYGYTVLNPSYDQLDPTQPWASKEWEDRKAGIEGGPSTLGTAWITRSDKFMRWEEYLEYDGRPIPTGMSLDQVKTMNPRAAHDPMRFAYTYGERLAINDQVVRVIRELRKNPLSRQLYVAMWQPTLDSERLGIRRVPCSIGWHFMMREDMLNVTYTMRSCDFLTHWGNDCWLTLKLLNYIADQVDVLPGRFCHVINSFHVYEHDVADVF